MQPLNVNPQCMSRLKLFATLRTVVTLVQMVFLNVIGEVGLVSTEVLAHGAPQAIATILQPNPHRHALDNTQQI